MIIKQKKCVVEGGEKRIEDGQRSTDKFIQ
jgi:hypothetical protein